MSYYIRWWVIILINNFGSMHRKYSVVRIRQAPSSWLRTRGANRIKVDHSGKEYFHHFHTIRVACFHRWWRGFRTFLLPPTSGCADVDKHRHLSRLLVVTSEINQFSAKHFVSGTHGNKLCCGVGDIEGRWFESWLGKSKKLLRLLLFFCCGNHWNINTRDYRTASRTVNWDLRTWMYVQYVEYVHISLLFHVLKSHTALWIESS